MEITYLGHSSFKLRGKTASVITDPFDPDMVGIKLPAKTEADAVTVSHQHKDHNFVKALSGNPLIIAGPGEYEIKGIRIIGVSTFHDDVLGAQRGRNTVYHFKIDGVSLVHLGDLGHKLADADRELLDEIDVLFVPVGGFYSLSPSVAAEVVAQLEPRLIIPMHYRTPAHSVGWDKVSTVDVFLKEMGKEGIVPQAKLVVSKDKIPAEPTIVVLE